MEILNVGKFKFFNELKVFLLFTNNINLIDYKNNKDHKILKIIKSYVNDTLS